MNRRINRTDLRGFVYRTSPQDLAAPCGHNTISGFARAHSKSRHDYLGSHRSLAGQGHPVYIVPPLHTSVSWLSKRTWCTSLLLTFKVMHEIPRLNLGCKAGKDPDLGTRWSSPLPGPYVSRVDFQCPVVIRESLVCATAVSERRTNSIIQQPILGRVSI
jgi:hypothetical protein